MGAQVLRFALLASWNAHGRSEPVANQRIKAGDVLRGKSTSELLHHSELIDRRAASRASGEMVVDAALVLIVKDTLEIGGKSIGHVDAAQVHLGS